METNQPATTSEEQKPALKKTMKTFVP